MLTHCLAWRHLIHVWPEWVPQQHVRVDHQNVVGQRLPLGHEVEHGPATTYEGSDCIRQKTKGLKEAPMHGLRGRGLPQMSEFFIPWLIERCIIVLCFVVEGIGRGDMRRQDLKHRRVVFGLLLVGAAHDACQVAILTCG